ncbi:MAG: ANTAR domain-containing response regulator [Burkholderiaceae bacterium]
MLKVVILGDNAASRDLLNTVLTNGGHHVVGDSNTSPAGRAKMIKLRPQVVCIDIGQAYNDGLMLLDSIRTELPKALVFLVSGKIDSTTVESALQRGVHGFIVKPFNPQTVLTTIRNTILKIARQQRIQEKTDPCSQTDSATLDSSKGELIAK